MCLNNRSTTKQINSPKKREAIIRHGGLVTSMRLRESRRQALKEVEIGGRVDISQLRSARGHITVFKRLGTI